MSMFFKRTNSSNAEKPVSCSYKSSDECPYQDDSSCKFDKEHCAQRREKDKRKRRRKNMHRVVCMIAVSCVLLIVFFGIRARLVQCDDVNTYWHDLLSALIGVAFSVLAAAILAIIIDVPSWLRDYEEHFANILSSNSYLKTLDEKSLVQLRQDITTQIHKTTTPRMPRGLVKMDESICALFKRPYYERYMHSVRCKMSQDRKEIEKTHVVEFKLINPNCGYSDAVETIRLSNLIQKMGDDDKGIMDFKMSYRIDDKEEQDLSKDYGMASEPLDKKIEFYDTKVYLAYKPEDDANRKVGIELRFNECVIVKYSYTIKIDAVDRCFTKRLQHPAELFILNYSCDDDDISVQGQLIGTDLKQSNVSIHYHDENSISLVSYDWLLPDNGAVVVMLDKKRNMEGVR